MGTEAIELNDCQCMVGLVGISLHENCFFGLMAEPGFQRRGNSLRHIWRDPNVAELSTTT